MKLYITDGEKITKFNLPKEIQESVLITYKSSFSYHDYIISIESVNGNWFLKSNGVVNVIENNMIVRDSKINNYSSHQLEIYNNKKKLFLYCFPLKDDNYIDISTFNVNTITIGNSTQDNIVYQNSKVIANHVIIYRVENNFILQTSNFVYLNGIAVENAVLKLGDVVFVEGLKLIWMGNFIRTFNPNNLVTINGLQSFNDISIIDNTQYEKENEDENVELYSSESYFFHTPRIRKNLSTEKIEIDSPPEEDKIENTPFILAIGSSVTMAMSSLMMGYTVIYGMSTGTRTLASSVPQIIMCVAMVFGSLVMPRVSGAYQNRQKRKKEELRQRKYNEYLDKKNKEIMEIIKKQSDFLNDGFPKADICSNIILKKDTRLWERQIIDNDFLNVRLGSGNIPTKIEITAPKKTFSIEEDDLKEKVFKLVNDSRNLENVSITTSFLEERVSAIVCNILQKTDYINNLILQLITFHSASDLKIIYLTENDDSNYKYFKYLPHCFSDDKKIRYYATKIDDMKIILESIDKELKERKETFKKIKNQDDTVNKENIYSNFSSYFLIITDCYKKIKNISVIENIIKGGQNYGISLLLLENSLRNLPPQCQSFAYVTSDNSYYADQSDGNTIITNFKPDIYNNIDMDLYSQVLSNIPIESKIGSFVLPKSLTFMEMYGVSKIEQLNILNRWRTNNPVNNLKVPIGVHSDMDLFMLDLHEKAHGPHGLIAGSTGSGKSEFIITFVLSMAINFHPNEVQFVLIDYKGGGLTGAFENREKGIKLPHLAGTITNLDTAEMNRTLVSINSELKRRQQKFNEVRDRLGEGTIDIYKYQKLYREGVIKEPISHLFIISDEFAELKSQQPEFMDELISTSRIGRSLGVHLILATQKPSGVVNDQIWANSKFKICLKVQDRGDSMEMLKRPEAASIKEIGRFYLQVGYDEYFDIGQSGYSGAKYIPSDRIVKKVDNSISFIDNIGNVIKSVNDDEHKETLPKIDLGDQLTNIVKYIVNLADKQKIKTKMLWLTSIPDIIYLGPLAKKYNYTPSEYLINPVIGEYDNPSKQEQGLLTIDLTNIGHTVIYGMTGSGKENLLTTLITSSCISHSPNEVNFYIFDFGSETLRMFSKFPHVGGVCTLEDKDQIVNTLMFIDEEASKRKELFLDYAGNYKNYINESGKKLPLIVLVINNYEVFTENYAQLSEAIFPLIREGSKYGIVFVVTTSASNGIRGRAAQLFMNKMVLQMNRDTDYRDLIGSPKGLIPKKYFGRGIVRVEGGGYEFQTACICEKSKINLKIRELTNELQSKYNVRAKSTAVMPDNVTINFIANSISELNSVPIGFSSTDKEIYNYDFDANVITLVLSKTINNKIDFVKAMVKIFNQIDGTSTYVIDSLNLYDDVMSNIKLYNQDFNNALIEVIQAVNKEADGVKRIFIFVGLKNLVLSLNKNGNNLLNALFSNINRFKNSKIIIFDDFTSIEQLQNQVWYEGVFGNKKGIWLGDNYNQQKLIDLDGLTIDQGKEKFNNIAYVKNNKKVIVFKYVTDMEE